MVEIIRKFEDIKKIIEDCEEYQTTGDSKYHKERAKLIAYDEISDIITKGVSIIYYDTDYGAILGK